MPYIYKSGLQFGINETNIYGGASYVELTQAEYDALSDAEKHNGQIYFITDGNYDFLIVNDSVPVGSIQAYGGMSAPTNWLICDGRAVSRTDYKELFQVIGVFFGEGDGATTFNLPDLTGRVAIGHNNTYSLGAQGGNKDAIIPYHNHSVASSGACTTNSTSKTLTGSVWNMAVQSSSQNLTTTGIFSSRGTTEGVGYTSNSNQRPDGFNIDATHSHGIPNHTHTVNYAGTADNTVDANMQPYLVTNYIIKAKNPSVTSGQQLQAMELFYPVGSYYETSDLTFDPNVEWGGTWVSKTIENNDTISGTPTFTGSHSGNWSSLTKVGKMVQFKLSANFNMSLTAGTNTPIGSIPEGFRPISEVVVGGYIVGGTYGFVFIEPDGTIMLQRVAAGTGNLVRQNIVYFTSQNEVEKICWHRTA